MSKQQKILAPVFNPKKQPGYTSRFKNSPFETFFGDWQIPLIAPKEAKPNLQVRDEDAKDKFRSLQSPNVIPSRRGK